MERKLRGPVPPEDLRRYLLLARAETFDQKPSSILLLPQTYFLRHSSGSFHYRVILFGGRRAWRSQKVEAMTLGDRLVWHGFTHESIMFKRLHGLEEQFFEFRESVLKEHPEARLDQTVKEETSSWRYRCKGRGYIDDYRGVEIFRWRDQPIARGVFSGGLHTRY